MANSRTWYSWVDAALADCSTATKQAQSVLWAIKAALKGELTGGTLGPAGAIPGGARWTHYASSDGSGAAIDSTDRWLSSFDASKINRASSGAHSWIVLANATLGVWLTLDWLSSADANAIMVLARAAPTGGSTSLRPTSSSEVAFTAAAFIDSSAWTAGKCHFTTDADGNFYFFASKNTAAKISTAVAVQTLTSLAIPGDDWPQALLMTGAASTTNALTEASNNFWRGGTNGVLRTMAYNPTGPVRTASVATCLSYFLSATQSLVEVQAGSSFATGQYRGPPAVVCTTTAGVVDFKGLLPDVNAVASTLTTGTRYPAAGDIERIVVGSAAVPLTAVPTL